MIAEGIILMLLGALALGIVPAERLLASRRWFSLELIQPALRRAFPAPTPEQQLERLVVTAEAAVESATLRRRQQRRALRLRRN